MKKTATDEQKQDYINFIETHKGEIIGLYNDSHYKNGGWNGIMSALRVVEERYNMTTPQGITPNEWEKIVDKIKGV